MVNRSIVIALILALGVSGVVQAQTQAEKDEASRQKPKNNIAGKVLGVAAGAGAIAVAAKKGGEGDLPAVVLTPEQMEAYLALVKKINERNGKFELRGGYMTNFSDGDDSREGPEVFARFRFPSNFALTYEFRQTTFSDDSKKWMNRALLEYELMPLVIGDSVSQIGGLVGVKVTKVSSNKVDPVWGVSYRLAYLDSPVSLRASYLASLVSFEDFTLDSEGDISVGLDFKPVTLGLGTRLDVTDLENIKFDFYASAGIKF